MTDRNDGRRGGPTSLGDLIPGVAAAGARRQEPRQAAVAAPAAPQRRTVAAPTASPQALLASPMGEAMRQAWDHVHGRMVAVPQPFPEGWECRPCTAPLVAYRPPAPPAREALPAALAEAEARLGAAITVRGTPASHETVKDWLTLVASYCRGAPKDDVASGTMALSDTIDIYAGGLKLPTRCFTLDSALAAAREASAEGERGEPGWWPAWVDLEAFLKRRYMAPLDAQVREHAAVVERLRELAAPPPPSRAAVEGLEPDEYVARLEAERDAAGGAVGEALRIRARVFRTRLDYFDKPAAARLRERLRALVGEERSPSRWDDPRRRTAAAAAAEAEGGA
jgi:hypothetical protein